jgi:hypothetical protein
MKAKFKATHELAYDKGVWLRVQIQGRFWMTKEGTKFPANEDSYVRPLHRR